MTLRAGAMSLNQVVPNVANSKIGWFHSIKSQKSSGSIAPFSKIDWFHGTTGTITNAGPVWYTLPFILVYSCSNVHSCVAMTDIGLSILYWHWQQLSMLE